MARKDLSNMNPATSAEIASTTSRQLGGNVCAKGEIHDSPKATNGQPGERSRGSKAHSNGREDDKD